MKKQQITLDNVDWELICDFLDIHKHLNNKYDKEKQPKQWKEWEDEYTDTQNAINKLQNKLNKN